LSFSILAPNRISAIKVTRAAANSPCSALSIFELSWSQRNEVLDDFFLEFEHWLLLVKA
jgi:hypothetical protein